jgi:RNA polymerase sigma-70 factor (ECF subfamily)
MTAIMDLDLLIQHFRGPLTGLLASWGNDRQSAIELAQDTFAEAWFCRANFVGSFDDVAAVGPWLRGIARNLHRRQHRTAKGPARMSRLPSLDEVPPEQFAASPAPQPSDAQLALEHALSRLKLEWRTVLTMRYLEGSGLPEIAAVMDLSVRSVEGLLHRARKELQAILPVAAQPARGNASSTSKEIAQ